MKNPFLFKLLISTLVFAGTIFSSGCSNNSSSLEYPLQYVRSFDKESTLYVIGHKSPDSDTVCSSIAYAKFLNGFGFKAEAVIPSKINGETQFVLNKFEVKTPKVMTYASNNQFAIMDHSSYGQSIEGMKDAKIMAVLDHHEMGDFKTEEPILYKSMPVGCTSTIVYNEYKTYNINIPKDMAGMMLSAILSDTLGLKSPTTTDYDKEAVVQLTSIAGITDYKSYTTEMLDAGNTYDSMNIKEIAESDLKYYESGETDFMVGYVQSTRPLQLADIETKLNNYMKDNFSSYNVDMGFFMLVDLLEFKTKLLCYGKNALETAQKAFNVKSDVIMLENVVSRKLQVVPPLKEVLKQAI